VLASSADYNDDSSSTAAGSTATKPRYDLGTKDAPVDGKDGKPHEGPFVELTGSSSVSKSDDDVAADRPALVNRPEDPTMIDGVRIPESNDGVMDDKERFRPKEGTTGTEGGVSQKEKERKAMEGQTGEKAENRPDSPKEAPPLPHSEEEKILKGEGKKDRLNPYYKPDGSDDVAGLEVMAIAPFLRRTLS